MAIKYASHAAKMRTAQTQGSRAGTLRGEEALGNLIYVQTTYTVESDDTNGDEIELTADLPESLSMVPAMSKVVVEDDPGTGYSAAIGTEDDADAYSAAIDLKAVGEYSLGPIRPLDHPVKGKVIATLSAVDTPTAGAKITWYLAFRAVS